MKAPPTIDLNDIVIDVSINLKRKRDEHWARLRRAWVECPSDYRQRYEWLEEKWGLRVHLSVDGMITDDYTVVDEKKYLIYLLKFG